MFSYRGVDFGALSELEWEVVDAETGKRWHRAGGGWGGGDLDGDGGQWFTSDPRSTRARVVARTADRTVMDAPVDLTPAPAAPLPFRVIAGHRAPDGRLRELIEGATDAGWRRGSVVPDDVAPVLDAAPSVFSGGSMTLMARERWGSVDRFLAQVEWHDDERLPLWWDLEVDGNRVAGLTDGFQGGPWGNVGHIVVVR